MTLRRNDLDAQAGPIPLRRAVFALAVLLLALSPGFADPEEFLTTAEQVWLRDHADQLVLGPEKNYPPFVFSRGGAPTGLSMDYVRLLEQDLQIEFKRAPPDNLSALLERARNGEVHVLTSLKETPERAEFLLFTRPYARVPAVIIVRKDDPRELSLPGLKGLRIAVGEGYGIHTFLTKQHPQLSLAPVPDDLIGLRQVSFGEADAVVMDLASASYFLQEEGISNLRVAGSTAYTYDLSFAVRRDQPILHSCLEKALARVSARQEREIQGTWISLSDQEGALRQQLWTLIGALALALGLIATVTLWNASLKGVVARRTGELADQAGRSQALLDAVPDLVFLVDGEGQVLMGNDPEVAVLAFPPAEFLDRTLGDLPLPESVREQAHQKLNEALALGTPLGYGFRLELEEPRDYDARVVPSGANQALWIVRDVTAQKRRDEQERLAEEQAIREQKLESLGVLAGGVAHDFNNLLTAIMANAELASLGLPEGTHAQGHLEGIVVASRKAADLCRQMLAYSGKGIYRPRELDLGELVREASPQIEELLAKRASLVCQLPEESPQVKVDPEHLTRVLLGLVANASEAIGEEPGVVTVGVSTRTYSALELSEFLPPHLEPGTYLQLDVSDTGEGMSPEVQQKALEPFFSTKFLGRGLGLAAILGILRTHRGAIRLRSQEGEGTLVSALLPPAKDEAAPPS